MLVEDCRLLFMFSELLLQLVIRLRCVLLVIWLLMLSRKLLIECWQFLLLWLLLVFLFQELSVLNQFLGVFLLVLLLLVWCRCLLMLLCRQWLLLSNRLVSVGQIFLDNCWKVCWVVVVFFDRSRFLQIGLLVLSVFMVLVIVVWLGVCVMLVRVVLLCLIFRWMVLVVQFRVLLRNRQFGNIVLKCLLMLLVVLRMLQWWLIRFLIWDWLSRLGLFFMVRVMLLFVMFVLLLVMIWLLVFFESFIVQVELDLKCRFLVIFRVLMELFVVIVLLECVSRLLILLLLLRVLLVLILMVDSSELLMLSSLLLIRVGL